MDVILNQMIAQVNADGFMLRVLAIIFVIMYDFIVSIMEAIKLKNFSFKKLPDFASNLVMSIASISLAELLVCLTVGSVYVNTAMMGLREIILLTILSCFIVKAFQSMEKLGWTVSIKSSVQFLNNKEKEAPGRSDVSNQIAKIIPDKIDDTIEQIPDASEYVDPGYNNTPNDVTPMPVPPGPVKVT